MILPLYLLVVVIWGTNWLAVAFQSTNVAVPWEISIFYRFLLAAIIQFIVLFALGRFRFVPIRDHVWLALLGVFLFSFNFLFFYNSVGYMSSGLASIIFAMAILLNFLNEFLFYRRLPSLSAISGVVIGMAGVILVFWDDFRGGINTTDEWFGVLLAVAGIYCFSIGNVISYKLQQTKYDLVSINSYAFFYGCIVLAGWNLFIGHSFEIPLNDIKYVEGLLYLSIPGTIIGFGIYLYLIGQVGLGRPAYATMLYPVIALGLSSLFGDFQWQGIAIFGVILIVVGNAVLFVPAKVFSRFRNSI